MIVNFEFLDEEEEKMVMRTKEEEILNKLKITRNI